MADGGDDTLRAALDAPEAGLDEQSDVASQPESSAPSTTSSQRTEGGGPMWPKSFDALRLRASEADLSDQMRYDWLRHSGSDKCGRPVFLILAHNLPAKTPENFERMVYHFVALTDPIVTENKGFVVVFIHSSLREDSLPPAKWLRKAGKTLPKPYHKLMKTLHIVLPTRKLRTLIYKMAPFVSIKIWKKVKYSLRLEELWAYVEKDQLELPAATFAQSAQTVELGDWEAPRESDGTTSVGTVLQRANVVYERNVAFQRRFGFPSSDYLRRIYMCSVSQGMFKKSYRGELFLSKYNLAFGEKDGEFVLRLPLSGILKMEKDVSVRGRAIRVTMVGGDNWVFSSFKDTQKAYESLVDAQVTAIELYGDISAIPMSPTGSMATDDEEDARTLEGMPPQIGPPADRRFLTREDWSGLLRGAQERNFLKGDVILEEGDQDPRMFYLRTGDVRIVRGGVTLALLHAPTIFGEMGLIEKLRLPCASVVAESEGVEALSMTYDYINCQFFLSPGLAERFHEMVAANLASRLREANIAKPTKLAGSSSKTEKSEKQKIEKEKKKKKHTFRRVPEAERRERRNEKFRKQFSLPEGEEILYEYSCSAPRCGHSQHTTRGRLFASRHYFAFYAKLFGMTVDDIFPINCVTGVDKADDHTIHITVRSPDGGEKVEVFKDFKKRDDAWGHLEALWRIRDAHDAYGNPMERGMVEQEKTCDNRRPSTFSLTKRDWTLLLEGAQYTTHTKREVIIREGDDVEKLIQLVKGSVTVEVGHEFALESRVVASFQAPEILGEVSFLHGVGASASVLANEDETVVVAIPGPFVHALFQVEPTLAGRFYKYLGKILTHRLYQRNEDMTADELLHHPEEGDTLGSAFKATDLLLSSKKLKKKKRELSIGREVETPNILVELPSEPLMDPESANENEAFRRQFHLPESEFLVAKYSCALTIHEAKLSVHGKLYLSRSFMCFSSKTFGRKKKEVIYFMRVEEVTWNGETKPPSIEIGTSGRRHVFKGFNTDKDARSAYDYVFACWTSCAEYMLPPNYRNAQVSQEGDRPITVTGDTGSGEEDDEMAFTQEDWEYMLSFCHQATYAPNMVIVREGTVPKFIFQVDSGVVRVELGREGDVAGHVLARFRAPEFFGEMSLIEANRLAVASVIADGVDVSVLQIDQGAIQRRLESNRGFATRFFNFVSRSLARRLVKSSAHKASLIRERTMSTEVIPRTRGTSFGSTNDMSRLQLRLDSSRENALDDLPRIETMAADEFMLSSRSSHSFQQSESESNDPKERRNRKFRRKLGLPSLEEIVDDYVCHFGNYRGRLYLSVNCCCFYARIFAAKKRIILPYSAQLIVRPVKDNSLVIETPSKTCRFDGFKLRNLVIEKLESLNKMSSGLLAPEVLSRSVTDPDALKGTQHTMTAKDWENLVSKGIITLGEGATTFMKGDVVIREGELCRKIFQLAEGSVRVVKEPAREGGSRGPAVKLATLGEDEVFGEVSVLLGTPSSASIIVDEDNTQIFHIPSDLLKEELKRDVDLAARFYNYLAVILSRRLQRTNALV